MFPKLGPSTRLYNTIKAGQLCYSTTMEVMSLYNVPGLADDLQGQAAATGHSVKAYDALKR